MKYLKLNNFSNNATADTRRLEFNFKNEQIVNCGICPDIIFIGDSITNLWQLNAYFKQGFIVNRGIGGDKTEYILKRFQADAISLCPQKIILLMGINDILEINDDPWWKTPGKDAGIVMENFRNNFEEIAKLCLNANIELKMCSILPTNLNLSYDGEKINLLVEDSNDFIKSLVSKYSHTYVDYHSLMINENTGRLKSDLSIDGVHPNFKGYKIMSECLRPYLFPYVTNKY